MKLLITGARGFVGSSLAEYAAQEGCEVLGIGRTAQAPPGWPGSYAWADVALSDVTPIFNGFRPDVVVHCAGSASVSSSLVSPLDDLRATVLTLANTLDGIRRSEVRPFLIYPSSAAVYGNPVQLPVREDGPCSPISPYGFHKLAAEQLVHEYVTCHQLRAVICRIFSVVGKKQKRLLLWDLYQQFIGPSPEVVLQGTGDESRDFIHIDDLCATMLHFAQLADASFTDGSIVNVASGVETSVRSVAHLVKRTLVSEKPVIFSGKPRFGDPGRWVADCTKLQSIQPDRRIRELAASLEKVMSSWQKN
jgi:UDP-glucose 4-epimerase